MSSENFLRFKNAYLNFIPTSTVQQHTTMLNFTLFFRKIKNFGTQNSKWIKLLSTGIIIYSSYYYFNYLKRTIKVSENSNSFFSCFYRIKHLFSQRIGNISTTENKKNNLTLEVKELPEHVKYDNGWYNELDELKKATAAATSTSLDSSGSSGSDGNDAFLSSLRETTPRGEIIMYYDSEKKSFNYYSNSKNIPYSTLDAVARKYVCLHSDPSIYIDIRDEIQKGREKRMKKDKDDKSKLERNKNKNGILSSAKKSLFAAFKNYKTGPKSVSVPKSLQNCDGNIKVEEFVVIKDNINKFIYKGTLEQYESDLKSRKNNPPKQNRKNFHSESDSNVVEENQHSFSNSNNNNDANNDNNVQHYQRGGECDYFRLSHEKEDLSYADFKKKYNH